MSLARQVSPSRCYCLKSERVEFRSFKELFYSLGCVTV
jgi:hypothetical protein